nr:DUF1761 domain-containing protein [Kibdelosporangium sp. MJ126-NF4]CEL13050.1 hypothetical protein [Kibdelosporangium sp. MJ126-NF4]CTQ98737.1 hypothetical protein [Kibdelosporangium sp. MJ126-NF4]
MTALTQRAFARTFGGGGRVVVAALATIVASTLYYMVFGEVYQHLRGGATATPDPVAIAVQVGRNILVAAVLATLLHRLAITTRRAALGVGALVWLGFQAMAVLGSVIHEHYPFGLYLLHIGDALLTTLVMVLILGRRTGQTARTRFRPYR